MTGPCQAVLVPLPVMLAGCCYYRVVAGMTLSALQYHQKSASAVAWSPQDGTLASASRDGTIALWDLYKTA